MGTAKWLKKGEGILSFSWHWAKWWPAAWNTISGTRSLLWPIQVSFDKLKRFISLLHHSFVVVLLIMLSLRTIFTSLVSCSERYNKIIYGMLIKKMKELQNACSFRVRETSRNRDDFIVLDTFANFTYHTQCQCSMYSCF